MLKSSLLFEPFRDPGQLKDDVKNYKRDNNRRKTLKQSEVDRKYSS
jgi:hypothetical protein